MRDLLVAVLVELENWASYVCHFVLSNPSAEVYYLLVTHFGKLAPLLVDWVSFMRHFLLREWIWCNTINGSWHGVNDMLSRRKCSYIT